MRDKPMRQHPSRSWTPVVAAGLIALAGATSCSDAAEPPASIPCDIGDARCRAAIFALTAQMRGQSGAKIPPTRIITREQFATETRADVTNRMSSRDDQVYEATLRLLHFLSPDTSLGDAMADSNIAGVAAYYDSQTKAVTIIADAAEDTSSGSLTLSHEYTHALQDQREGLTTLDAAAHSTDEAMAINALVEGEATILSDATMARAVDHEYNRDDVLAFMARLLHIVLMNIEQSVAPFNEGELALPYPVGGLPVANAYLLSGSAGVQALFPMRPSTLTGWVQLGSGAGTQAALPAPLSCDMPDAPAGYVRTEFDRLGATGLIALYTRLGLDGGAAFDAARAWTGDSFTAFAPMNGTDVSAAFAWRIGLVDEPAALKLESLMLASTIKVSVLRKDREVVLSGATDPAILSAWSARNDCSTAKGRVEPSRVLPPLRRYWR